MTPTRWLTADEAAERLHVKPATLYAYVSRGQLRRRDAADARRSEYHPGDVADLAVRGRRARPPRPSDVIVPTAVTEMTPDGPAYRGRLAVELAGAASFEVAASHLWAVEPGAPWRAPASWVAAARAATRHLGDDTAPAERLLPAVAALRSHDALRGDLRAEVVVATARRLIATLVGTLGVGAGGDGPVAARLAAVVVHGAGPEDARVGDGEAPGLIEAVLVLLADHELAASTLAARVAASARCDPYAVVLAGLAVLSGRRHGAASLPLERALADIAVGADPARALERQLQAGAVPGFGHPLYPDGDPRAVRLLELLGRSAYRGRTGPIDAVLELGASRGLPAPNIDAALAGVTHAVGAPPGTGELLFAIARIAGWIAHALEQYAEPHLLRPTAVYTG